MKTVAAGNGMYWKAGLALLVGVFLAAMVASFIVASRRGAGVVPGYYPNAADAQEKVIQPGTGGGQQVPVRDVPAPAR